jgi:hypothetical protein
VLVVETTWGPIRVEIADGRVVGCELPPVGRALANAPVLQRFHGAVRPTDRDTARRAEAFLRALWAGRRAPLPACRLPPAGVFVTEVWRQLARVPPRPHGELRRIGGPRGQAARGACGGNGLFDQSDTPLRPLPSCPGGRWAAGRILRGPAVEARAARP